ncbi:MAG: MarR family transcriptional regulator [Fidelibacterota bacterium]|nr:MAG: MarR family transcriptional regulator [Candidatus Neomarinimicrobiota bacterium]
MRILAHEQHLSLTQAQVMLNLPVDGLGISLLAHRLGLDVSTMSRVIAKMEEQGWVSRDRDAKDRRISRVMLTTAGNDLHQNLISAFESEVNEILTEMDTEQQEFYSQHLEELTWRMMRHRQ